MKQQIDGKEEKDLPPKHHNGRFVFQLVRNPCHFWIAVKGKMEENGKGFKGCATLKTIDFVSLQKTTFIPWCF
jgi:hypothetical protein